MSKKLSEMMALGSTMMNRYDPNTYLRKDNDGGGYCGCAIGMGLLAAGVEEVSQRGTIFPWLHDTVTVPESAIVATHATTHDLIISQMFRVLCTEAWAKGEVPRIDGILDYVRSVEPQCGECNRHECACVAVAVPEAVAV